MKLYLQWLVHGFCSWGLQHCWFVLTDIFPCSQLYHHSLHKDKDKSTKQFSHSFPGYPLPRVHSYILLLVVNFVILHISIVNLPPNSSILGRCIKNHYHYFPLTLCNYAELTLVAELWALWSIYWLPFRVSTVAFSM